MVLPILQEAHRLGPSVQHFQRLLRAGDRILLATSGREDGGRCSTTARVAEALADGESIFHVHVEDADARKGDQVNLAGRVVAEMTPAIRRDRHLMVIYDIDSRPPLGSLHEFARLAGVERQTAIFHQSARFEVRDRRSWVQTAIAEGAALRANRYVASYELPRLMSRRPGAGKLRRTAAAATFGHVTGHGLGIRLSWLTDRPLPSKTEMEDLVYSFGLAVGRVPVSPLASLDQSEVPASYRVLHSQAERWFRGPARAVTYRASERDRTIGRELVTLSALLITLEWLSCALAGPILVRASRQPRAGIRLPARILLMEMGAEVVAAELMLGSRRSIASRAFAPLMFPIASAAFGFAGWSSMIKGALGKPLEVKTG